MRSLLLLVAVLIPCVAFEATVVPNIKLTFGPDTEVPSFSNYRATIDQDLLGDYTGTSFLLTQASASAYSLKVTASNLDKSADWYLVGEGD